ncbi:MAG TPA: hypothetical protein HPP97_11455 [Desulfuromonadales bacterium]|nr:hypothetical protein [Desulfuromonadales bacterium]
MAALMERVANGDSVNVDNGTVSDETSKLMSRFLGQNFAVEGLSQEEIFSKFSTALNTLFDSINRIMAVINETLLGENPELATIRKIIGSNIDGEGNVVLIGDYLERIQKSFLVAHTSFQHASSTLFSQILDELAPDTLSKTLSSGFKFGALRKAELYDLYEEKYTKIKRWHECGQYMERLLRDFEKRCQQEINKL